MMSLKGEEKMNKGPTDEMRKGDDKQGGEI